MDRNIAWFTPQEIDEVKLNASIDGMLRESMKVCRRAPATSEEVERVEERAEWKLAESSPAATDWQ